MTRPVQARSIYTVNFLGKSPRRPTVATTCRVTRTLALAHTIDAMIRNGGLKDLADAARVLGLSRARVTQLSALLLLAPSIQEAILDLPPVTNGRDPVSERALRRIVAEPDWDEQRALWSEVQRCEG